MVRRIEKLYFTEIYELSDDDFLYLFTNLIHEDIVNESRKKDLLKIKYGDKSYLGLIVKEHSNEKITSVIEDLTILKGFQSVAGMRKLKELLLKDVINPLLQPERFKKFKVSIPNGVLLYGPPGCGKTFIVRKLAEELKYKYYEIKHSDLATPFIHGSVSNIGKVFEMAKMNAPAIIFLDEISGLVPKRDGLQDSSSHKEEEINEFLMQLNDASDNKILVVAATNYPDRIDMAILRSGRMDKRIYVSPPDFEARKELFKIGLSGRPTSKKINFDTLANLTENYASSDIIEGILENVSRSAANDDKPYIDQKMIEDDIKRYNPIDINEINRYESLAHLERW
ncbi:MAG: ATP-binding protein [Candidatus Komeilibacteria bacterium]|nr:ATP-binding protein [Candidatus Komeilibacteria bacterium]